MSLSLYPEWCWAHSLNIKKAGRRKGVRIQKKPTEEITCMGCNTIDFWSCWLNAFMFILRKACEAGRTRDYFTKEYTGLELNFYKMAQVKPESSGSKSSVPSTWVPWDLSMLLLCVVNALFHSVGSVVRQARTDIPLIHKVDEVHPQHLPCPFPSMKVHALETGGC